MMSGTYRTQRARCGLVGGLVVIAGVVAARFREAEAAPEPALPTRSQAESVSPVVALHRFVGAGSCAAAACHGGAIGKNPQGSEYTIWIQADPHARAYTTLFNRQSQTIARNLGLDKAHTAAVCLKCHSLAGSPAETASGRTSVLADGVSCEACHGAAEHWLEPHKRYNLTADKQQIDWRHFTSEQKSAQGYHDTKSIATRAQACLKCHVGEAGRDVDHDLIAAGHPRLYFELSTYVNLLPAHWDRAADRKRHPDLEASQWMVGQFAAAEASLGLLHWRATTKVPKLWPEFAEYGCFGCHHNLGKDGRSAATVSPGKLGRYQWNSWNSALVRELVSSRVSDAEAKSLAKDLAELAAVLEHSRPDADKAAKLSSQLQVRFHNWAVDAERVRFTSPDLRALMAGLLSSTDSHHGVRDWEASTQLYLALQALVKADQSVAGDRIEPQVVFLLNELPKIYDLLKFPAAEGKLSYSSPTEFDVKKRQSLAEEFRRLQEQFRH
ncbi:MAG: hypothetical protein JSS02_15605 [Planctomycetes bacterium]|nr:hypothetical protein [Planctomycetota bacterium]